jgi:predicted phage gp36 major capsid-like protein
MADLVNLRQFRKQQRRRDAEAEAAANRARHGASKAEREKLRRESKKAEQDLDSKKLD